MLCSLFIFVVTLKLCDSNPAFKCCPLNQALSLSQYQCAMSPNGSLPHQLSDAIHFMNFSLNANESHFPHCDQNQMFINRPISFVSDRKLISKFTQYCVDVTINGKVVLVGCVSIKSREKLPEKKVAIRKCCSMGEHAFSPDLPCKPGSTVFKPNFYSDVYNTSFILNLHASDVDIVTPGCSDRYLIEEDEEPSYLLKNGSIFIPSSKVQQIFNTEEFCLENTPIHDSTQVFLCFKKYEKEANLEHWLSGIGIIISISFLIATFLVYATDKKKRHLYGQTLMCHIASFTVAFICLVAAKIFAESESEVLHEVIAYTMYFSFTAGFFWQNVMCIDLWRTFRAIRSRDCHSSGNKLLRFIWYSGYAWGSSVILTVLVIYLGKLDLLPEDFRPTLNDSWLDRNNYGYYIFFIGPIGAIIAVNIVLYIITARRCYQVKAEIGKRLQTGKSRFFRKKEQLSLSSKLFVVMGMTWSLEVISFILKSKLQLPPYIFLLSDAMNTLYGLLIFIIFVIRKKMVMSAARCLSSPRAWVSKRNGQGALYHQGPMSCVQQSTITDSAYSSTHVTDMENSAL